MRLIIFFLDFRLIPNDNNRMKTIKRVSIQGKTYFYEMKEEKVIEPLFMIEYHPDKTTIETFKDIPPHQEKQRSTVAFGSYSKEWNRWLNVQIKSPRLTGDQRVFLKKFFILNSK